MFLLSIPKGDYSEDIKAYWQSKDARSLHLPAISKEWGPGESGPAAWVLWEFKGAYRNLFIERVWDATRKKLQWEILDTTTQSKNWFGMDCFLDVMSEHELPMTNGVVEFPTGQPVWRFYHYEIRRLQ